MFWPDGIRPAASFADAGLAIGADTCLIRFAKGRPDLAAGDERCRALFSILCRRPVSSAELAPIDAAAAHWARGDKALANLRLVFSKFPRLSEPADAYRLQAAEYLLDAGISPHELMMELGLNAPEVSLGKYDPDQPRVPVGSGPESGRWTDAIDLADTPHASSRASIILAASQTTPGGVIYGKKIENDMKARHVTPEQIDEAVRFGSRIDAINKATGSPAIRHINPTTGQSIVIDTTTNNAIHVGKPDYEYGPNGGDVPRATMRPAPAPPPISVPIEEPVVIPDVILPP